MHLIPIHPSQVVLCFWCQTSHALYKLFVVVVVNVSEPIKAPDQLLPRRAAQLWVF